MAGATTLGDLASAIGVRSQEEAVIVAELKAGSDAAYAWLIGEFQQPVYGLVYRIVNDPADAADTTQDVFLKVFRGMNHFHGESSLKTWIYRIALHEAANRRRWWFRHKAHETSMEPMEPEGHGSGLAAKESFVDGRESPFDSAAHEEVRARVLGVFPILRRYGYCSRADNELCSATHSHQFPGAIVTLNASRPGGILAVYVYRWLESVALTDCSYLQMQRCMFRMAAILNQVLLRLMGGPNSHHD